MALDFSELKKSRSAIHSKLVDETNKIQGGGSNDDTFWQPTADKAGNGFAVIRFLPAPPGEELPWVRVFSHGFQGPGGWYIENCLTTIGKEDPVAEMNSMLWNRGDEAGKEQARKQKRKLRYVSNVLIVKDPAHPENNGKVFKYGYGKKIFDKINDAMNPATEGETRFNPFDFWEGANFQLKIRQVEGYRNYDMSVFESQSPIPGTDEDLEKIWKSQYSLAELVSPDKFKSYDELKKKLYKTLGQPMPRDGSSVSEPIPEAQPQVRQPEAAPAVESRSAPAAEESSSEELDWFAKLAQDD